MPFTDSVEASYQFLAKLVADGGGDMPEDVHGGLRLGLEQSWES